jgi:hypothetical protein
VFSLVTPDATTPRGTPEKKAEEASSNTADSLDSPIGADTTDESIHAAFNYHVDQTSVYGAEDSPKGVNRKLDLSADSLTPQGKQKAAVSTPCTPREQIVYAVKNATPVQAAFAMGLVTAAAIIAIKIFSPSK